jgi:hypothetical protein
MGDDGGSELDVLRAILRPELHLQPGGPSRKSAVRIRCNVWFSSGPNDYSGTVTSSYLFGSNNSLEWTATYTMHWVNDQCYFHSGHPSRCRITTRRGNW